jgi:hypothetical protein
VNRIPFNEPTLTYRLPRPAAPVIHPGAFMLCPLFAGPVVGVVLHPCQLALYQAAFEQAQAAMRPSLLERDLVGVWN